jgi:hypothetical protein
MPVYIKRVASDMQGCEVVRMYDTILGREGFRKGIDLYFERHDGSAVTCDDFLAAMADANSEDLSSLATWCVRLHNFVCPPDCMFLGCMSNRAWGATLGMVSATDLHDDERCCHLPSLFKEVWLRCT